MSEPLIINNFETGIAESPHKGFGLMRNVDIEAFPGAVKAKAAPATLFAASYSSTFTSVAATDISTATATVPITGIAVKPTTTGTLPGGLTPNTVYFIGNISSTTFYFYDNITNANAGGATGRINITDTGTGTHTITTVNPGTINHIIKDTRTNDRFFQDSNGRVWFGNSSSSLKLLVNSTLDNAVVGSASLGAAFAGNGIVLYKQNDSASTHYLLAFRNNAIDIINVYGDPNKNAPSWTNAWNFGGATSDTALNSTAGSNNSHHAIVGQDNIIYFCDGRFVGTIKEISGQTFDPANTATYVGNDQALDLPENEVAQYVEELGTTLLIASNVTNKIYPWDRLSDSFNYPIFVPALVIKKLKNVGGLVYILAGTKGDIYYTQGSYVRHLVSLPDQVINNSGTLTASVVTWGGIAALDGNLLVGASVQTSGNSGVYLIDPNTGKIIIDQIPSTGSANVTAFEVTDHFYYFGYAGGADYHTTTRYSALEAVVQSQLYRVATKIGKATYSSLEVVTAKPATTGAQIRIGYRTNTSAGFTTLATYTADSSATTFQTDIGLIDIENIQIQAEFDDDVELLEIRLLP